MSEALHVVGVVCVVVLGCGEKLEPIHVDVVNDRLVLHSCRNPRVCAQPWRPRGYALERLQRADGTEVREMVWDSFPEGTDPLVYPK